MALQIDNITAEEMVNTVVESKEKRLKIILRHYLRQIRNAARHEFRSLTILFPFVIEHPKLGRIGVYDGTEDYVIKELKERGFAIEMLSRSNKGNIRVQVSW